MSHEHDWGASTLRLPQTARERFQQLPAPPSQYSAVFSHRNRFALPRSGPAGKLPVLFPSASFFDPEATVDGPPADSAAGTTPRGVWPEASSTTTSSRRSHRSTGTKFCVEAYRSRKAQREGLPASGEEYWREELQNRKREEIDEERLRTRHWKANVKPWLKERTKPRPNTNQRRLRAFRSAASPPALPHPAVVQYRGTPLTAARWRERGGMERDGREAHNRASS